MAMSFLRCLPRQRLLVGPLLSRCVTIYAPIRCSPTSASAMLLFSPNCERVFCKCKYNIGRCGGAIVVTTGPTCSKLFSRARVSEKEAHSGVREYHEQAGS